MGACDEISVSTRTTRSRLHNLEREEKKQGGQRATDVERFVFSECATVGPLKKTLGARVTVDSYIFFFLLLLKYFFL